jgi:hypothetical protein
MAASFLALVTMHLLGVVSGLKAARLNERTNPLQLGPDGQRRLISWVSSLSLGQVGQRLALLIRECDHQPHVTSCPGKDDSSSTA